MEYPRTVILEDGKLKTLLQEKTDLVISGRELSQQIENCENDMQAVDKEIQEHESRVDVSDIHQKMNEVTEAMRAVTLQMAGLKKELHERLRAQVPVTFYEQYEALEVKKKKLEEERNKVALKVQKKNDKIIPLSRKLMSPHIQDEFEDYDSIRLEGGQIIATIFSHMQSFIDHFRKKKSQKV